MRSDRDNENSSTPGGVRLLRSRRLMVHTSLVDFPTLGVASLVLDPISLNLTLMFEIAKVVVSFGLLNYSIQLLYSIDLRLTTWTITGTRLV